MDLNVIILAAGKGSRLFSKIPKVMHKIGGVPMLERVVRTAEKLNPKNIQIIYGSGGETVKDAFDFLPATWVKQTKQLGTGHAVMQALPNCDDDDQVLVLYGDVPLISEKTLTQLLEDAPKDGVGLVVTQLDDPSGLGRVIRNEFGNIVAIVEDKDADALEKQIKEINTGIITAKARDLKRWLPAVKNHNTQKEYYLPDIIPMAVEESRTVGGVMAHCHEEVQGVNDRLQLAWLERYFQYSQAEALLVKGVCIHDPHSFETRAAELDIAQDVVIDTNVILVGKVKIGSFTHIGPNVIIKDTEIGEHCEIRANSMMDGASVANHAAVGPYARLRPGSEIGEHAHVGNFVEVKKSKIGKQTKINHLSYIGDATIGEGTNIGAGTITCNYDGKDKHPTTIGDNAFIGSNTAFVAPVKVGDGALVAAGSTITEDVTKGNLAIARSRQVEKEK